MPADAERLRGALPPNTFAFSSAVVKSLPLGRWRKVPQAATVSANAAQTSSVHVAAGVQVALVRKPTLDLAVLDPHDLDAEVAREELRPIRSLNGSGVIASLVRPPLQLGATVVDLDLRATPGGEASRQSPQSTPRRGFSSTIRTPPSLAAKMSTGQASSSLRAGSASARASSETSTWMKIPFTGPPPPRSAHDGRVGISAIPRLPRCRPTQAAQVFSAAVSSLPSTIMPAWPKLMCTRHLVHEAAGHEGHDRQPALRLLRDGGPAPPPCDRRAPCR